MARPQKNTYIFSSSFLFKKITSQEKEIRSITKSLKKLESLYLSYDFIKLSVASPMKIRQWAQKIVPFGDIIGEVLKPDTINFRTRLPELFGLFCEQIFGPITSFTCRCGFYKGAIINKICKECGIEVTESRVRRYRMGYIQFVFPIAHCWYFKGLPNYLLYLSRFFLPDIKSEHIAEILYYKEGIRFVSNIWEKRCKFGEETPRFFPFLLKKLSMRGQLEKYYRVYNQKKRTEAKYSQEYCLKVLLYNTDYEDMYGSEDAQLENKKNKKLMKVYKEIYGEKYATLAHLLDFEIDPTNIFYNQKEIKVIYHYIQKKYKEKKIKLIKSNNISHYILTLLPFEVLSKLSFIDLAILRRRNIYLYEEFPTFTPRIKALFKKQKMLEKELYCGPGNSRKGADIFQHMLQRMHPQTIIKILRTKILKKELIDDFIKIKLYNKQFRIFNSFFETKTNPGWIILTSLPILPPTLRPFVEIDDNELVSADLNELYRVLIFRNNRLAMAIYKQQQPDYLIFLSRKNIQEATDSLIDNARILTLSAVTTNDKPLKGLTEILEGKFGRFRHTLLGKRIDYSGRSVIIVNPQLKLNQCGVPYYMGITLFKPVLINQLIRKFFSIDDRDNTNNSYFKTSLDAIITIENRFPITWRLIEILMRKSTVLLNRAPTLHKLGLQGFNPILTLGQAIHLHPLVCTGFNADFDGDQMAIHLPLYKTTQLEIKMLTRPSANVLLASNGEVSLKPSQDIVIGCYYLTLMLKNSCLIQKYLFNNENEILYSLSQKFVTLHTPILLRYNFCKFCLIYTDNTLKLVTSSIQKKKIPIFFSSEEITVFKIFQNFEQYSKIYFFTNFGLLIGKKLKNKIYQINEYFFETTPGRILFSNNLDLIS